MSSNSAVSALTARTPGELAAFYAEITGGIVTNQNEYWASMNGAGGRIDFWTVPDHHPATGPTGRRPTTPSGLLCRRPRGAEAKVLAACASKYEFKPNSDHCYVFADPAGHPFCLSTWGNPDE